MKKLTPFLLLLLLPFLSLAQQADQSTITKIGDVAPTFDFYVNKTQKANIKDYRGK